MIRKRLQNGDLFYLYEIPDHVEGYIQNPHNIKHFIQVKPPCILRVKVACGKCPSNRPTMKSVCRLGRPLDCVECDERQSPYESP